MGGVRLRRHSGRREIENRLTWSAGSHSGDAGPFRVRPPRARGIRLSLRGICGRVLRTQGPGRPALAFVVGQGHKIVDALSPNVLVKDTLQSRLT